MARWYAVEWSETTGEVVWAFTDRETRHYWLRDGRGRRPVPASARVVRAAKRAGTVRVFGSA